MPSLLKDLIRGNTTSQDDPLPQAHFVETHLVHTDWSWREGTEALKRLFPRETRPERPAEWYRMIALTHGPGRVPPGNGPFYLPDWVFGEKERAGHVERLEDEGFEEATAHACVLPSNNEYLAEAMRLAGDHPWTANPVLYRVYLYPDLTKLRERELRDFNVERDRL